MEMAQKRLYPRFLIRIPWWFDVLLAGAVYYTLKYWLPTLYFKNAMVNRFVHALPQFAEIFAFILLVNAAFSAFHAWRNRAHNGR
jgi:hypothetical protein